MEKPKSTSEPVSVVTLRLAATMAIVAVLVFIAQMWFELMNAKTFVKVEMTFGALFLIFMFIYMFLREQKLHQRMTEGSPLDE